MIILTFVRLWHPSRVLMFSFLTGGRPLRSDAPAIFCQRSALNQPPGNLDLFCIRKFHAAPVHSPLKWKQKLVALDLRPALPALHTSHIEAAYSRLKSAPLKSVQVYQVEMRVSKMACKALYLKIPPLL